MVRENGLAKVYPSVRQNPPNLQLLGNTRALGPGRSEYEIVEDDVLLLSRYIVFV